MKLQASKNREQQGKGMARDRGRVTGGAANGMVSCALEVWRGGRLSAAQPVAQAKLPPSACSRYGSGVVRVRVSPVTASISRVQGGVSGAECTQNCSSRGGGAVGRVGGVWKGLWHLAHARRPAPARGPFARSSLPAQRCSPPHAPQACPVGSPRCPPLTWNSLRCRGVPLSLMLFSGYLALEK